MDDDNSMNDYSEEKKEKLLFEILSNSHNLVMILIIIGFTIFIVISLAIPNELSKVTGNINRIEVETYFVNVSDIISGDDVDLINNVIEVDAGLCGIEHNSVLCKIGANVEVILYQSVISGKYWMINALI
jgi:hypothetical protein